MSSHNTLPHEPLAPLPVIDSTFVKHTEIDLFEILSVIVKARKFIILVTLAFAIAGLAIGAILPQKWTSNSVIIAPESDELMGLDDLQSQLHVAGLDTGIDSNYLLATYMRYFDSRILRDDYLQHSEYFQNLMQKSPDDQLQKRRLLDQINTDSIKTFSSMEDKQASKAYSFFRLSFSAKTPDAAKNLLQGYMDYVEKVVRADIIFKIQRAVTLKLQTEQKLFDLEMLKVQNARDVRINKLKYALSIAGAAGLKKPVYSNGAAIVDDPDYAITLGSDALNQKLKVEESISDPLSMSTELRNSKMRIDLLKNIQVEKTEFKPFKYLQKPEVPSKKDEPKRMIILIIFTMFGLMGAVVMALMHNLAVNRREQVNPQ